jgi:hypothetical protein
MATTTIPSPCPKSNLTRRQALQGTAACGALALPAAGVALTIEASKLSAAVDEPLIAMWAERQVTTEIHSSRESASVTK